MSIVLQMARTKQKAKGEGEVVSQLSSHKGVDWPQAQLLLDQYQDQLQFQGVKHCEAEHQQGKGSASVQAPYHQRCA